MPKSFPTFRKPVTGSPTVARQAGTGLMMMAIAVVQTCLIAWFGFALSGRLELALKERQTTLQANNSLAQLVEAMQAPDNLLGYTTAVRKFAMYGSEAVQPLTIMAAATGPYSEEVPIGGLRLIAMHHKNETCNSLKLAIAVRESIDAARFISIKRLHEELKC